jgi:hypothetical protein
VDAWLQAKRRAIERSALVEAALILTDGLSDLDRLPPGDSRVRAELALLAQLAPALLVTKGYASEAAQQAFERLRALGRDLGAPAELFLALRAHGRRDLPWRRVVSPVGRR